ncbi:MAG: glycosyltransferase family 9 protein [Bdellovibrionales bacterium]
MRILIVQLARLGDIITTYPSIQALRRENPEAEIDLMVRPRFRAACKPIENLVNVMEWDSKKYFEPLLNEDNSIDESLEQAESALSDVLDQLNGTYDKVINLSFSPASSFLVSCISNEQTIVSGYTRFDDGFLKIPDDASAYFYAQVGISRQNRFHLMDLFSEVAGVALQSSDYRLEFEHDLPEMIQSYLSSDPYLVIHVGASDSGKALSKEKWVSVVNRLKNSYKGRVALVGSPEEKEIADYIYLQSMSDSIINLVGKTDLLDLFPLIRNAELYIGCDSGPLHIASMENVRSFNLSNSYVNFFETGPKAENSRILFGKSFDDIGSDTIVEEILGHLSNDVPTDRVAVLDQPTELYITAQESSDDFGWNLVRAIYLGTDFPVPNDIRFVEGLNQLQELNVIAVQQLLQILKVEDSESNRMILDRVDDLVDNLVDMVPELQPLVSWYQTEKLRVGPGNKEQIVEAYTQIHENLAKINSIYLGEDLDIETEKEVRDGTELSK